MSEGFFGLPWLALAGIALVISALFTVFQVPKQTPNTTGLTHFALQWCHSIAWLLLALSFALRAAGSQWSDVADAVGLAGLGSYVGFRVAASRTRHVPRVRTGRFNRNRAARDSAASAPEMVQGWP